MEFYTVKEIAELLLVNDETVRRWIRDNKLSAERGSGRQGSKVLSSSLRDFLYNNKGLINKNVATELGIETIVVNGEVVTGLATKQATFAALNSIKYKDDDETVKIELLEKEFELKKLVMQLKTDIASKQYELEFAESQLSRLKDVIDTKLFKKNYSITVLNNLKIIAFGSMPQRIVELSHNEDFEKNVKITNEGTFQKLQAKLFKKRSKVSPVCAQTSEEAEYIIVLSDLKNKYAAQDITEFMKEELNKDIISIALILVPYSTDNNELLRFETDLLSISQEVDTLIPLYAERLALEKQGSLKNEDGIDFRESYMEYCLEQLIGLFNGDEKINFKKEDFESFLKDGGLGCILFSNLKITNDISGSVINFLNSNDKELKDCNKFMINISSGEELNIIYVNSVIKCFENMVNQDSSIYFKATKNDELIDDVIVTVIGI